MKKNFSFLTLSESFTSILTLAPEAKEKQKPFIIVNTDNDRGLYVRKLEEEIAKYKGLKSEDGESKFFDITTSELIIFGDSTKFDYRTEMNYITIVPLSGKKDVKVYNLVEDFNKVVRRLSSYCRANGIKKKAAYRDEIEFNFHLIMNEPKKRVVRPTFCPLAATPAKRTLVNFYEGPKYKVEEVTVHSDWVKIGWNQYDIFVDMFGNEFITLEDGLKLSVKEDRFGRRFLVE